MGLIINLIKCVVLGLLTVVSVHSFALRLLPYELPEDNIRMARKLQKLPEGTPGFTRYCRQHAEIFVWVIWLRDKNIHRSSILGVVQKLKPVSSPLPLAHRGVVNLSLSAEKLSSAPRQLPKPWQAEMTRSVTMKTCSDYANCKKQLVSMLEGILKYKILIDVQSKFMATHQQYVNRKKPWLNYLNTKVEHSIFPIYWFRILIWYHLTYLFSYTTHKSALFCIKFWLQRWKPWFKTCGEISHIYCS